MDFLNRASAQLQDLFGTMSPAAPVEFFTGLITVAGAPPEKPKTEAPESAPRGWRGDGSDGALREAFRYRGDVTLTLDDGSQVEGYVASEADRRAVSKEEVIREITDHFCIPEIPADEDVAEAVVFLASDRARMITGQYLMVNSGELMT